MELNSDTMKKTEDLSFYRGNCMLQGINYRRLVDVAAED